MNISIRKIEPLQKVKYLLVLIFVMIIVEGVFRKYLLPQFSDVLFFSKDIFVLYVYYLCFRYQLFPVKAMRFLLIAVMVFMLYGFLQCILLGLPLIVMLIGLRSYFFLLPLALVIAYHYTIEDILKILRIHLFLAIPIAILIVVQHNSSPEAFINRGTGLAEMKVFTVVTGVVRTYGTFSFIDGQVLYINFLFTGILFFILLLRKQEIYRSFWNFLIITSAFVCLALSGARGAIAHILVLLTIILAATLLNVKSRKTLKFYNILWVGLVLMIILGTTVLSSGIENLVQRFVVASQVEDTAERVFSPYTNFVEYMDETNFIGKGLGASSGAGAKLMTGERGFALSEGEWQNVLLESGYIFGFFYLMFRVVLLFLLLMWSFKSFFLTHQLLPVVLTAGLVLLLLQGQLIRGGTPMYFCWFFVGLTLAMIRINNTVNLSN